MRPVEADTAHLGGAFGDGLGALGTPRVQSLGQRIIAQGQNGHRQKRRVDGARAADGERADGHASGHLHDGALSSERIVPTAHPSARA